MFSPTQAFRPLTRLPRELAIDVAVTLVTTMLALALAYVVAVLLHSDISWRLPVTVLSVTAICGAAVIAPLVHANLRLSEMQRELERLAETAERCRKIILASRIAIAGGFALMLAMLFGALGAGAVAMLGSIALALGGIVSLGSNVSTLQQTDAAIRNAEALRSELIGSIDLRVVQDAPMKLM